VRLKNLVKQTLHGVLYIGFWGVTWVVAIAVTGFIWPSQQAQDLWSVAGFGLVLGCWMLFIEHARKRGWMEGGWTERGWWRSGYSSQNKSKRSESSSLANVRRYLAMHSKAHGMNEDGQASKNQTQEVQQTNVGGAVHSVCGLIPHGGIRTEPVCSTCVSVVAAGQGHRVRVAGSGFEFSGSGVRATRELHGSRRKFHGSAPRGQGSGDRQQVQSRLIESRFGALRKKEGTHG